MEAVPTASDNGSGAMDVFCNSTFWDANKTWFTENPELSPCFQNTVLVWTPCLFLWVFSSMEFYYLLHSKHKNIHWNWLNISKLVLTGMLVILSLVDVGHTVHWSANGHVVSSAEFYSPLIKIATFSFSALLLLYNRIRGMITSGLLFLFWLLLAVCGVVRYHYELTTDRENDELFEFISYMVYYPLVLAMLLLSCFADAPPAFSEYPPVERPCPEQRASFLSKLFFAWFDPFAWKGFRTPLEAKDLWNMNPEDAATEVVALFDKHWQRTLHKHSNVPRPHATFWKSSANVNITSRKQKKKHQASILPVLCKAFGAAFIFGAFLHLMEAILKFVSPQILRLLIGFVEGKEPLWKGYLYAAIMLLTASLETIFLNQYYQRLQLVGLRIRTALTCAIYRKALRLSNAARKESTVGEIVNLMSVDAQRFVDVTTFLNYIWSAPLQIGLALYFLWEILGPSVLAGLAVMIILIPMNGFVASYARKLQVRQMKKKDERVKLMNEVLSGMKVLKLYAWEESFEKQILKIRDKEMGILKQAAYMNATTSFMWCSAPFLVSLVSLGTYVLVDSTHVLDAEKAFVSLSLFNIIRVPITFLPQLISTMIQASVSLKRLNKFFNCEEMDPNNVEHEPSENVPLVIENGTFSWGSDEQPVLRNISLSVKQGSLVAIVGTVGSGKSSLLSAFLGEIDKISGRVNTKGCIAYVPQQAWIQNATLQDNILFGHPHDPASYQRVVEACALKPDLDTLPGGDQTEIGEKGINLSGGQKQRVSLARAVYNNADVYFLDDPLSAVDSHVGKHIFENVIGPSGMLQKKTRVLVTHGITFLPDVDLIVVLSEGEVTELGTYKQLLEKKGAFADFLVQHLQEVSEDDGTSEADLEEMKLQLESTMGAEELRQRLIRARSRVSESQSDRSSLSGDKQSLSGSLNRQQSLESSTEKCGSIQRLNSVENKETGNNIAKLAEEKLIEEEKAETGSVKWHVYAHYFKSVGLLLSATAALSNLVFQCFSVSANFWLSEWSSDDQMIVNGTQDEGRRDMYLGVYGALGACQAFLSFGCEFAPHLGCWTAAKVLHIVMLRGIMQAPLSFFDTTPIGRILGRFAKDVDVLDTGLPQLFSDSLYCLFEVIATLVVISYSTPIFISVILPIGIVYSFIQQFYVATSRQLKRLESVSRSPIYSHFGESITGAATIRAYNVEQRFVQESENRVDYNQACYYSSFIANRWLAVRLEMIGNLIIFFASLFAVLGRDSLTPGLVGLSVSYALQITKSLNWMVRMASDVETNIVAVERIKEYGETKQEAPWEIPSTQPPSNWPDKGEVIFKDYQVRYRKGLELVLKGISFTVKGGEKVGIVGRTGAGKSSLTLGLFRIIEPAGGQILIDGVDISRIGLHALRSRLTIIPQDPVLFSGTLRINLDPFETHSDADLWRALEHAHLKAFVKGLPAELQHQVTEGGENLSIGQRQLICLARALLRKTKVLILDEATAAVDLETDDLIQRTIRSEFKDCTVLTIAHRLNTIMDSNRIVVLDRGRLVEYDAPEVLLQNRQSVFYGMAKDAGLV